MARGGTPSSALVGTPKQNGTRLVEQGQKQRGAAGRFREGGYSLPSYRRRLYRTYGHLTFYAPYQQAPVPGCGAKDKPLVVQKKLVSCPVSVFSRQSAQAR